MKCTLTNFENGDRQASILIVDDSPINIALLKGVFGQQYRLYSATSGPEAVAAASLESFDLILLDIMMPGMDGFQTLERLRSIRHFFNTPVIFLTACTDELTEQTGLSLGAADYITKPFVVEHIKLRVANILERTQLQKQLELVLDSAELGIWEWNICANVVRIDQRRAVIRQVPAETEPGTTMTWEQICHPDHLGKLQQALLRVADGSAKAVDVDVQFRGLYGNWAWMHVSGKATAWGGGGQATQITGTYLNIEKRKAIEEARDRSEERLRLVMEATGEGVWDWVIQDHSVLHNASWCTILGLDENFLVHDLEFFKALIHPDDLAQVEQALIACISGRQHYVSQHRLRKSDGEYVWVLDRGKIVEYSKDGIPLRMVGSIKDISEQRRNELEIQRLAFYDFLTGLPNRRLLVENIGQAILRNNRKLSHCALMFIDMDRFKELNDTLGHDAGDSLLVEVAKRLRTCVRSSDAVARLGGDEFIVMLSDLDTSPQTACIQAEAVGNKILAALNLPYKLDDKLFNSTPSIGLTIFSGKPATVDNIMKLADKAMYKAKASGRNCLRKALPETDAD